MTGMDTTLATSLLSAASLERLSEVLDDVREAFVEHISPEDTQRLVEAGEVIDVLVEIAEERARGGETP